MTLNSHVQKNFIEFKCFFSVFLQGIPKNGWTDFIQMHIYNAYVDKWPDVNVLH